MKPTQLAIMTVIIYVMIITRPEKIVPRTARLDVHVQKDSLGKTANASSQEIVWKNPNVMSTKSFIHLVHALEHAKNLTLIALNWLDSQDAIVKVVLSEIILENVLKRMIVNIKL